MSQPSRALALLLALAGVVAAQDEPALPRLQDTPDMGDLPARWQPLLAELQVPGLAVAVVKRGALHGVAVFGKRDVAQELPVTPDTLFYMASVTKTYMAFLVCELVADGTLALDDPVRKHLPAFRLADPEASASITIRDLLTHRAGLESAPIETLEAYTGEIDEERFARWLERVAPDPGITYSNLHYTLLGRIVAAVTGGSWKEALQEKLLEPAGMSRTTSSAQRLYADEDHADPLELRERWVPAELVKSDATMHAAGGLGTTARDAGRWLQLNLNDGEIDGTRLLPADLAALLRKEQLGYPAPRGSTRRLTGRGFAWETGTFAGQALCHHGGGYFGTTSYVALLPDQRSGFFLLMNSGGYAGSLSNVVALDLLCRLTGAGIDPDPLESTRAKVRDGKAQDAPAPPGPAAGPLPRAALRAAPSAYAAVLRHADWGTLRLAPGDDRLRLFLGQAELSVLAGEAGAFTVQGPVLQGSVGTFVLGKDGKVASVSLDVPEQGRFDFER